MLYLALVVGFGGGCRFEVKGWGVEDAPDSGASPVPDLSQVQPPDEDLATKPPDLLPVVPLLSGAILDRPGHVNLSMVGTLDWVHWGLTNAGDFNHKSGVSSQISSFTVLGSEMVQRFAQEFTGFSWMGGTPTAVMAETRSAATIPRMGSGYRFTVGCDGGTHTLRVYLGGYASRGRFEARITGTTLSYGDQARMSFSDWVAMYVVEFRCAKPSTLEVEWRVVDDAGTVSDPGKALLAGATLQ
jgi:hypothetical protein